MAKFSTNILSYYQGLNFNTPNNNQGDRIIIGQNSDLQFRDDSGDLPFTIECWVLNRSVTRIFSKTGSNSNNGHVQVVVSENMNRFILYSGHGNNTMYIETQPKSLNEAHHIAFTYDGSQQLSGMNTYVNGELAPIINTLKSNYSGIPNTDPPNNIGVSFPGNSSFGGGSDGIIKEFRIWDHVRTQQQIQNNMNNILQGDEEGLVVYYPMNEGVGNVIYDHSVNEINGVINGATWTNKVGFKK